MKRVREIMGLRNVELMVPFVRTTAEAAAVSGVVKHGGKRPGAGRKGNQCDAQNGHHLDFSPAAEVDLAAQSQDFHRGYHSHGSTGRFYRFRVLKTKAPKFAQRVLDGRYTRQRTDGTYFVDLGQAEEDAEKANPERFKKFRQQSRAKPPMQKAKEAIAKLSPQEFKQIVAWIRSRK
jgi:hypothetical protein